MGCFRTYAVAATACLILLMAGSPIAVFAQNMDCSIILPANPLTAEGLATPYQLIATDPANGPCNEANSAQSAFVQAAIFDPATHQISVYKSPGYRLWKRKPQCLRCCQRFRLTPSSLFGSGLMAII